MARRRSGAGLGNELIKPKSSKVMRVSDKEPIYIKVEDADSKQKFMSNARQAYRIEHPEQNKPRGRKSEEPKIVDLISKLYSDGQIDRDTSQGQIIRLLVKKLPPPVPHEDTILRYVKSFRLMTTEDINPELGVVLGRKVFLEGLSEQDDRWLRKWAPSIMNAIDKFKHQLMHLQKSGKSGEPFNMELNPFRSKKPINLTVQETLLTSEDQNTLNELFGNLNSEIAPFRK